MKWKQTSLLFIIFLFFLPFAYAFTPETLVGGSFETQGVYEQTAEPAFQDVGSYGYEPQDVVFHEESSFFEIDGRQAVKQQAGAFEQVQDPYIYDLREEYAPKKYYVAPQEIRPTPQNVYLVDTMVDFSQVGCRGEGAAIGNAICMDKSHIRYRVTKPAETANTVVFNPITYFTGHNTAQAITYEPSYEATAYCANDEVAISGMGACTANGFGGCDGPNCQGITEGPDGTNRRPIMVKFAGEKLGNQLNGWTIGCRGPGKAVVQAVCVKKKSFNKHTTYSLSKQVRVAAQQNSGKSTVANAKCGSGEIAINGMGWCEHTNGLRTTSYQGTYWNWAQLLMQLSTFTHPRMVWSTGIQGSNSNFDGWTVACGGESTAAVAQAICVKDYAYRYDTGYTANARLTKNTDESYFARSDCSKKNEVAIAMNAACNDNGNGLRPSLVGIGAYN